MSGDDVKINLTRDEFEALLIMMGMAMGTAVKMGNVSMMVSFLKIANAVNRDNPNWHQYEIPNADLQAK